MSTNPFPIVLSFAATDPSGGAGLQADILILSISVYLEQGL
jgi:hydroxymethylpyrimidine/phosphomethylpyrimidine kinase